MQIHQIAFGDGVVEIAYTDFPADVRVGGQVTKFCQVAIDLKHPDYAEDAGELTRWAQRLLRNALEDFAESPPYEAAEPDAVQTDDDEGMGMGHGPKS
jgi:hypothetical protein